MTAAIDYSMPIDEYLSAPYVSCSKLRDFAQRGARYYAARHLTRTTPPPEDTEAQVFGRLLEDLVQGRGFDESAYAIKPDGMSFAKVDGKAWKKAQEAAGKSIVTADEWQDMQWMYESVQENEAACELIEACRKQVTLRGAYPGVPGLISRPDWLSLEGCALSGYESLSLDLKSTKSLASMVSGHALVDFRYDAQAAIVRRLLREATGAKHSVHYLLACEKCQPYRVQVIEVTPEWLDIGWAWCERQLTKLARCYEQNRWPRVDAEVVALPPPPAWASRDVTADEDAA